MIFFNSNPSAPGTAYHDIIIDDDPALTEYCFVKFSSPVNSNALRMIVHNDKDPLMEAFH
jgi:hypothetical protein